MIHAANTSHAAFRKGTSASLLSPVASVKTSHNENPVRTQNSRLVREGFVRSCFYPGQEFRSIEQVRLR